MKKLIALISVVAISSMVFAESEWNFKGSAGWRTQFTITQAPTPEGGDKPDAGTDMTWAEGDLCAEVNVSAGDVSGYAKLSDVGDVWAKYQASETFSLQIGKFGRPSFKVGGSKGPYSLKSHAWSPGGGGQIQLQFASEPSTFTVNLFNMKVAADKGITAINTVTEAGGDLTFTASASTFDYDAFLPEINLTYQFKNDVVDISAGGDLHSFKLIRGGSDDSTVQVTSFAAAARLWFTAGIFGAGAAGVYAVNPGVIGGVGDRGFCGLSYKLGETDGDLVNNNFIGFSVSSNLKLGDVVTADVGFGYGFNKMDIEGFENDAHMSAHLQFVGKAFETIELKPEVGFNKDLANYNGDEGNMEMYFILITKISF